MSKLITLAIFCFSLCILTAAIALHSLFQDYKALSYPQITYNNHETILEDHTYQKLKKLANYPFFGAHFKEPYIQQLTKRKLWEHVMQESQIALNSIVNARSYKIWYYKAVSQCATLKFQSCQKSLYEAEFLAPKAFIPKINKLKRLFHYKSTSHQEKRCLQISQI